MEEKREESKNRQFPNTVEEMKAVLERFDSSVIKEMPSKKRDLSTLSKLEEQLKSQKKTSLPPCYEYSKLEEVDMHTVFYVLALLLMPLVLTVCTVYVMYNC